MVRADRSSSRKVAIVSILLKCLAPRPMASLRLLCIPYAGAGVLAYRGWASLLPAHIEAYAVQLPGREQSIRAQTLESWRPMMEALTRAVEPLPTQPTAIFGHSLGAVIGLELSRWMQATRPGVLRHLFVSGRRWPGGEPETHEALHDLPDEALLEALDRQYGSLSTSLSHPDIRDLALPALRADLRLLDSHDYQPAPALDCPLTVYAGTADPATDAESIAAWQSESRALFRTHMFEGDHCFIDTHKAALVADITRHCDPTASHRPSA